MTRSLPRYSQCRRCLDRRTLACQCCRLHNGVPDLYRERLVPWRAIWTTAWTIAACIMAVVTCWFAITNHGLQAAFGLGLTLAFVWFSCIPAIGRWVRR